MENFYEKRLYKCGICGDFEADTKQYSKCKCGANEIKISYTGFSYLNGSYNILRDVYPSKNSTYFQDYKILEKFTYPFYVMTKPQIRLYNKIKNFSNVSIYEDYATLENGQKQLRYFKFEIYGFNRTYSNGFAYGDNEQNTVVLSFDLVRLKDKTSLTKAMLRFYKILCMVKNKQIDLNSLKSRDVLKELSYEYEKEQVKIYDYTFYC